MKYPDYHPLLFLHHRLSSVKHTEPSVCSGPLPRTQLCSVSPQLFCLGDGGTYQSLFTCLVLSISPCMSVFGGCLRALLCCSEAVWTIDLLYWHTVIQYSIIVLKTKMRSICFSCPWLPYSRVLAWSLHLFLPSTLVLTNGVSGFILQYSHSA